MNKKNITYGSVLLAVWIVTSLIFSYTPSMAKRQVKSGEHQEIIAPAIVDSRDDITRVPTLQGGIIKKIHVTVGQRVKKGDVIVSLDDTMAKHGVEVNKLNLKQAQNDLIIKTNAYKRAKAHLNRLKKVDKRAYSQEVFQDRVHEVNMAKLQVEQAQYHLGVLKENLDNESLMLKQFTTQAPKDGIVLQINAHVNEFVGGAHQILFLGDDKRVIVRVSIDERDINHFDSKALAFLTSNDNEELKIPLTFLQSDKYITDHERLNARVLEALYFFDRDKYPMVVAGQQFDAHIVINSQAVA